MTIINDIINTIVETYQRRWNKNTIVHVTRHPKHAAASKTAPDRSVLEAASDAAGCSTCTPRSRHKIYCPAPLKLPAYWLEPPQAIHCVQYNLNSTIDAH